MNIKEEKNLIIYRIENQHSVGPYHYAYSLGEHLYEFWQDKPHVKQYGCPTPKEDGLLQIVNKLKQKKVNFSFGFNSLEQIKRWFTPRELKVLRNHGFSLKAYKVKKAFVTSHQVLFIKD